MNTSTPLSSSQDTTAVFPGTSPKKKTGVRQRAVIIGLVAVVLLVAAVAVSISRKPATSAAESPVIAEVAVDATYTLAGVHPEQRDKKFGTIEVSVSDIRKLESIRVKGELVNIPEDKAFLSVGLELENKNGVAVGFFSRDYYRLLIDGKPYAPQFYNDGITLAPVSVKSDRVAFLIDRDLKDVKLQIGDPQKPSEIIEVTFEQ